MNNKMHLAINTLFYIFRGEHKLTSTVKPSKPGTLALLLNIIDNVNNSELTRAAGYYAAGDTDYKIDATFKKKTERLLGKNHELCSKGKMVRFVDEKGNNKEVLREFLESYQKNPYQVIDRTREYCDKIIGDVNKNKEAYEKIGRTLLCLIDMDQAIDDNHVLYICKNARSIIKKDLHKATYNKRYSMDFYPLLVGALYYIFENGGCEENGFETLDYWDENNGIVVEDGYDQISFEYNLPSKEDVSDEQLLDIFRGYAQNTKENIENKKLDVLGVTQDFLRLYVCSELGYKTGYGKEKVEGNGSYEKLKFLEERSPFSILIADGGFGKSAILKSMVYESCLEYLHSYRDDRVSVLLSLNAYNMGKLSLFDYICEHIRLVYDEVSSAQIKKLMKLGRMRVFFDAIDEVPLHLRKNMAQEIAELIREYPNCKYILSSRDIKELGYFDEKEIEHSKYYLEPFDTEHANMLIDNWVISPEYLKDEDEAGLKKRFRKSVMDNYSMRQLTSSPLLLSVMLSIYFENNNSFASRGMLYKSIFNIIYRRRFKKLIPGGGFNSSLSKKELKDFFAEFSALCWYDDILCLDRDKLNEYFIQIMDDNGIDEDVEDILRDFTEELGLLVNEGYSYSFMHSSFRDYFAADYFCNKKCSERWNVRDILNKEKETRELAGFMYDIKPDYCERMVLNELNSLFENWKDPDDDWDFFIKYMKQTYSQYTVLSEKRVQEYINSCWYSMVYDVNAYRTPLINLVHVVLNKLKPDENRYECEPVNSYENFDDRLCEQLASLFKNMKDVPHKVADCIKISGGDNITPTYIERTVYTSEMYGFDEDEEFNPYVDGEVGTILEELPNEGYSFTVISDKLKNLEGDSDNELKKKIKDILLNKNACGPFYDFNRLKVLRYDLNNKMECCNEAFSFGLRKL